MKAEFEIVTPEMAEEILRNHNTNNRKIKASTVARYVRDIQSGNWEQNGEPIHIDTDGNLKNGQHRLTAIAKAGVPVTLLVVRGVKPEVTRYDVGTGRSIADILAINGMGTSRSCNRYVGCAVYLIEHIYGSQKPSSSEVQKFVEADGDTLDIAYKLCTTRSTPRIMKAPIVSAFFLAMKSGVPESTIRTFAETVRNGIYDTDGDTAAVIFRNQLLSGDVFSNGGNARERLFMVAQNAVRDYSLSNPRRKKYKDGCNYYLNKYKENLKGEQA